MARTFAIHECLRLAHVPYAVASHPPASTAREEAAATHVPGRHWAKVVVSFQGRKEEADSRDRDCTAGRFCDTVAGDAGGPRAAEPSVSEALTGQSLAH
jgi:hypothetical protein